MSKQVVILHTGRCGSSMVAAILDALGVYMGDDLKPPDRFNPGGYWEDATVQAIHEKLLPVGDLREVSKCAPELQAVIERLIASRDRHFKLWGWKDAATIWTARLWHRFLSNPHYIWVWREPDRVITSTMRYAGALADGFTVGSNLAHTLITIEKFCRDKRCLLIDYDALVETKDVETIAEFLGITKGIAKARAVINPGWRTVVP